MPVQFMAIAASAVCIRNTRDISISQRNLLCQPRPHNIINMNIQSFSALYGIFFACKDRGMVAIGYEVSEKG